MLSATSTYKKLKKSYSNNLPEFLAIKRKLYPKFILDGNPKTLRDEIPVFTLHSVYSEKFKKQLQFLHNNSYQTLTADELYECLIGSRAIPERAIVLTFDDGWKNLHSVAYPLLKKYEMHAICFLIPGLISSEDRDEEKFKMGKRGLGSEVLCSWEDIKEMHASGIIDFQSHSMYHNLMFISSTIEDFFYPTFDSFALNLNIPLFRINEADNISRQIKLGTPIYKYASRFSGQNRYFDDENLRNECVQFVKSNGGEQFFKGNNWSKKLHNLVREFKSRYGDSGYFEDEGTLKESLFIELKESKNMIEANLPGKVVNHFCYPWWKGSNVAVEISKEAGYLTNFWGILPGKRTNHKGDDPYRIVRLLSDDYILRLPGEGRKSFPKIIQEKFSSNYRPFTQRLIQTDF